MRKLLVWWVLCAVPLAAQSVPGSPVERWGALTVRSGQLSSASGPVALRGVSLFDTTSYGEYANPAVLAWLRDDWKATVFRAAMYTNYNGQFVGERAFGPLMSAVQAAIDTGMYVIIDWHILSDGNPLAHLAEAKAFFAKVAERFAGVPNVLYEICNEPNGLGVTWDQAIKPYALEVIPVIRARSPSSVIIVGTPEWSSHPEVAAADPLPFDNLMYTLHFYAASHGASYLERLDQARAKGAAVFVTEWGATDANVRSPVNADKAAAFIRELDARGVSWANWSLGTKLETASDLKPLANVGGGWAPGELTENGLLMRSLLRGEPRATVFADNFQSGNFKAGAWARSGATLVPASETEAAAVRFEKGASLSKVLLSDAYRDWRWSLRLKSQGAGPKDVLVVEWSRDGTTWSPVQALGPASDWTVVSGALPVPAPLPSFQLRLRAQTTTPGAVYWLAEAAFDAQRD